MSENGLVLGLIPARGGSKGVKRKNLRLFRGKPLVACAIECGLQSGIFDRLIVSTDDQEIADVASDSGAEVPFIRPSELAGDRTPMLPVMQHAVAEMEQLTKKRVSTLVLIDPTAPLRSSDDILKAYEVFASNDCDAVVSAAPSHRSPYFNMIKTDGDYARLLMEADEEVGCRQAAPVTFDLNTVVWIYSRAALMDEKARLPQKTMIYQTLLETSVDIDTEMDWKFLELLESERD